MDVWQANDKGFCDVQQTRIQPDFNRRGVFRSNDRGEYWFKGVKPKFYPIPALGPTLGPALGPAGQLLAALAATRSGLRICPTASRPPAIDADDAYL